jgi:hypothetical protein
MMREIKYYKYFSAQYVCLATLFQMIFHVASISLKIEIFEKIHTTPFEILCTKSVLLSLLVILSLGLKIEHSYWIYTEFFTTLKQHISEMLGKITFQLAWPSLSYQTCQILADFPSLAKSLSHLDKGYSCIHLSVCLSACVCEWEKINLPNLKVEYLSNY